MAERLKVFAYYYPWYQGPGDTKFETNREFGPYLGLYSSTDPHVIHQHCQWAVEYGLSGFLVEWFGVDGDTGPQLNAATLRLAEIITEYPSLEFAIFYDQAIKFGGTQGIRYDLPEYRGVVQNDFHYLAQTYFDHPQYLKILNRPAVVMYLSRIIHRDFDRLVQDLRIIAQERGFGDLFVVGDEVWWKEVYRNLHALDAVTAYNLNIYSLMRDTQANAREYSRLCADLYVRAKETAQPQGITVFPHIGHAYNDRALRGNLPLRPAYEEGELPQYREDIIECVEAMRPVWQDNDFVKQTGDAYLFVNSWNEWPERSVIEPTLSINTWNELYDNRLGKVVYLQPPRFEYLQGLKEVKEKLEKNFLPGI